MVVLKWPETKVKLETPSPVARLPFRELLTQPSDITKADANGIRNLRKNLLGGFDAADYDSSPSVTEWEDGKVKKRKRN